MSGKLLVVGDSFCSRYVENTRKYHSVKKKPYIWKVPKFKYWFDYLSDKLNLELLNLSFSGAGNQQIFDNTLYALNTNDDIEFAVICWSEFDRIDLLNGSSENRDSVHINLSSTYTDINSSNTYRNLSKKYNYFFTEDRLFNAMCMMDKFINYSITVDNLLKHRKIKNIQAFSVTPFAPIKKQNRMSQISLFNEYLNHELFDKLNDENFFMYPGVKELGGGNFNDLTINNENYVLNSEKNTNKELADQGWIIDNHPNGEGNKVIFDKLFRFILDKYKKIV